MHYSIDCGIESVYGANLLLACLCLALFFADASLFPLSSAAAAQRTLPPRWQTGGCRRVAAGRRVAFGRRVAAGRRAVADGPSHAARWSCAGFFGLLGRRCAWLVWVGLTFNMATGCAVGKYRWDMTPTASAKLTATNTAEKSYELS